MHNLNEIGLLVSNSVRLSPVFTRPTLLKCPDERPRSSTIRATRATRASSSDLPSCSQSNNAWRYRRALPSLTKFPQSTAAPIKANRKSRFEPGLTLAVALQPASKELRTDSLNNPRLLNRRAKVEYPSRGELTFESSIAVLTVRSCRSSSEPRTRTNLVRAANDKKGFTSYPSDSTPTTDAVVVTVPLPPNGSKTTSFSEEASDEMTVWTHAGEKLSFMRCQRCRGLSSSSGWEKPGAVTNWRGEERSSVTERLSKHSDWFGEVASCDVQLWIELNLAISEIEPVRAI